MGTNIWLAIGNLWVINTLLNTNTWLGISPFDWLTDLLEQKWDKWSLDKETYLCQQKMIEDYEKHCFGRHYWTTEPRSSSEIGRWRLEVVFVKEWSTVIWFFVGNQLLSLF